MKLRIMLIGLILSGITAQAKAQDSITFYKKDLHRKSISMPLNTFDLNIKLKNKINHKAIIKSLVNDSLVLKVNNHRGDRDAIKVLHHKLEKDTTITRLQMDSLLYEAEYPHEIRIAISDIQFIRIRNSELHRFTVLRVALSMLTIGTIEITPVFAFIGVLPLNLYVLLPVAGILALTVPIEFTMTQILKDKKFSFEKWQIRV